MSETLPRRAFLRQLTALPLIGGAVTLIGTPTEAAVPVTRSLAEAYLGWLRLEECRLMHELVDGPSPGNKGVWAHHVPHSALPDSPDLIGAVRAALPSSRAAVILSAAGVNVATCDTTACAGLTDRGRGYREPDPFASAMFECFGADRERIFAKTGRLAVRS